MLVLWPKHLRTTKSSVITTASFVLCSVAFKGINDVLGQIQDWSEGGKNFSQPPLQKVIYLLHTLQKKNSAWPFMNQVYKLNMDSNTHRLLLSSLQEWPSHSSKIQELKEIKIITCLSGPSVHGLHVFSVMERSM